jgi:hypothetical protein
MKCLLSAFALTTMIVASAKAQTDNAPLAVEMGDPVPLAGAAPPDRAMAGDRYLVSFSVRNRLAEALRLRRVAFRLPEGAALVAPDVDGIDNDRDGAVDEGDEGFDRVDASTSAWRIDETLPLLPPGGSLERAVVVQLSEDAEIGTGFDVDVIAGGSVADATVRAERAVAFALAPPILNVTLNNSTASFVYRAQETPELKAVATLPSGRVSDFELTVKGSPAVEDYDNPRAVIGSGVECTASDEPTVDARKLSVAFGVCQVIEGSPLSERFVAVEATLRLRDAEPFADPDVIDAHRTLRLAGVMTRAEAIINEPVTVSGGLRGALIGARWISVSEQPVDAGDPIRASLRLVNRGDEPATGLRMFAEDEGLIDCESVVLDEGQAGRDACALGLALDDMAPGTQRDLMVDAFLRDDATINAEPALRLSLKASGQNSVAFPPAVLKRRMPPAPILSIGAGGEWKTENDLITARIGDAGVISISGRLPEGQYPASVRILSRVVDAQTGDPIAPAPLRLERFDVTATGGAQFENEKSPLKAQTVEGWTVVTLPLGAVSVPVAKDRSAPGYEATAKLSLRDLPEIKAGRLIEIAAAINLFDDSDLRTEDWAEILIAEPALDLIIRSPDEDRSIDLHDVTPAAVLSCNRGNSSAEAIILTVRLPDGLLLDPAVNPSVKTIPAEGAEDMGALFDADTETAGKAFYDADEGVLRGAFSTDQVLEPEACLALVFQVRRTDAFMPEQSTATVTAVVEPYTGRSGARGRVYESVANGEIRFDLPPILFGPVSDIALPRDATVAHEVSLELPAVAGPHRIDLSATSSTELEWTILQVDDAGAVSPWRNGTTVAAGEIITFRLETPNPGSQPLGWIDTTQVRALAFSETGQPIAATTRLVTRRAEAPGGRISVTKTMALDSDCDGNLDDERIQDALFEAVKDASPGDCVNFRIAFQHSGEKSMERIVVRDRVPSGTDLRPDAVEVLREPEVLHGSDIVTLEEGSQDVVWTFEGLFEPGAEGEVGYAVKLQDDPL